MAGILAAVSLGNNLDANGEVMSGALLRVYQAGTNTAVTTYKDSALTAGQEHPWPLDADSAGRLPIFFVADGNYRVRLTSADGGYIAYDYPFVPAISLDAGGGGGGSGVSSEVLFQTGDPLRVPLSGTRAGFVRMNGRTIGSASSGATERANSDVQPLYEWYWNNHADSLAAVTGGRGASAAADFAANKPIQLFDMRSRLPAGLDTMGNAAASRNNDDSFASTTTPGAAGGAAGVVLAQAELPAFKPGITITDPGHIHTGSSTTQGLSGAGGAGDWNTGGTGIPETVQIAIASAVTGISAAFTSNLGSGEAHNNMPPAMLGTWYQKL